MVGLLPLLSLSDRTKQRAVVPTKDLAKNLNNVQQVGWETVHRTCRVLLAFVDKPVPVEVLKVVVERVPKASLVKQQDKTNVRFAQPIGSNHKIYLKVQNV